MSVIDDINKRRTRQNPGGNEPVAQSMGDQASARVNQGSVKAESPTKLNPTAEQVATAKMLMPVVADFAPQSDAPAVTTPAAPAVEPVTTYTDIAKRINPELDAEAKAKREKQLRTKKQIAAIGDAISALANMHYTGTSGVNAYDPSATLSGKAKESYDKFLADVKSYEDAHKAAMLRGAELDAAATEARRKEAKEDARYKEQAAKADSRYQEQAAIAEAERKQKQENWEKQFEAGQAHNAETLKLQKQVNADNKKIREEANRIREKYQDEKVIQKMTNDFYGKPKQHGVDGPLIYDRVWQHSWPEVFKVMKAAGADKGTMGDYMYNEQFDNMTSQEKQNWVDEHYKEVPEAVAMMEELAKNTPESFRATQTKGDEDYSQYAVGGDDYSQYIIE